MGVLQSLKTCIFLCSSSGYNMLESSCKGFLFLFCAVRSGSPSNLMNSDFYGLISESTISVSTLDLSL
jgi:hypothetical protein